MIARRRFWYWVLAYGSILLVASAVGGAVWGFSGQPCWDSCIEIQSLPPPSSMTERSIVAIQAALLTPVIATLSGAIPVAIVLMVGGTVAITSVLGWLGLRASPIVPAIVAVAIAVPMNSYTETDFIPQVVFVAVAVSILLGTVVAMFFAPREDPKYQHAETWD